MSNQAQWIVITSIFAPTQAVVDFAELDGWRLVVAGDRKSPAAWECPGASFLSAADQEAMGGRLAAQLPWNHYCRKLMGYLHAMREGADVIADTDDDNLPKPGWSFPEFQGEYETSPEDAGFVNIYASYTAQRIWPRGYPLPRLTDPASRLPASLPSARCDVGVWQGLADGDPDVDAIYRLTDNTPCHFDERAPIVLERGTLCPFNSQNTLFRREFFPLLYLPAYVTFRFTDILRGLIAQPILWAAGARLGFTKATVVQERNPHDYLRDFESEIPCYLYPDKVIALVSAAVRAGESVSSNLHRAYEALLGAKIVTDQEMTTLEAWLADVEGFTARPAGA